MDTSNTDDIPKEKLVHIIKELLKSDLDLDCLLQLDQRDLEDLVAAIRGRVGGCGWG